MSPQRYINKFITTQCLIIALVSPSYASHGYRCFIDEAYQYVYSGIIEANPKVVLRKWELYYNEFRVDRDSGKVYGLGWPSHGRTFEVLHRGDQDWPFRALRNRGKDGIDYLSIKHYYKDIEKPFVYFSNSIGGNTFFGTCIEEFG